jgi:hypothetical protein
VYASTAGEPVLRDREDRAMNSIRAKIGGLTPEPVAKADSDLVQILLPPELVGADLS